MESTRPRRQRRVRRRVATCTFAYITPPWGASSAAIMCDVGRNWRPGGDRLPRRPALARCHGDPFPLPLHPRASPSPAAFPEGRWHADIDRRVLAVSRTLNRLASNPNSTQGKGLGKTRSSRVFRTEGQRCIAEELRERASIYGNAPDDLTPASALAEIARVRDLYTQEPDSLAAYDVEKWAVLRRERFQSIPLAKVLTPEA